MSRRFHRIAVRTRIVWIERGGKDFITDDRVPYTGFEIQAVRQHRRMESNVGLLDAEIAMDAGGLSGQGICVGPGYQIHLVTSGPAFREIYWLFENKLDYV